MVIEQRSGKENDTVGIGNCMMLQPPIFLMFIVVEHNIDQRIIYLLKNSLAVKKSAALFKMASVKKVVKSKGAAKKWL